MSWGSLTVGRMYLREGYELSHQVNATTGEQAVTIEGLESSPPWTEAQIRARQEDIIGLLDRALPVLFETKDNHSGFYTVSDTGTKLTTWPEADWFTWNLSLQRIGTENAVDMESRLASTVRTNNFALTGERWHAPSVGAYAYFTGSSVPSGTVSRVLEGGEGTITVYRGIPAGINPTWGVTAENYLKGRVRLFIYDQERSGVGIKVDSGTGVWYMTNGLVRVTPLDTAGSIRVESWDGAAWSLVAFDIWAAGETVPEWDSMTVLRNDFECMVVRLVRSRTPSGRTLVDLTLRRGSRILEGYIQTDSSNTLAVVTNSPMAGADSTTGYTLTTAADGNGNKLAVGSPITHTANTTNNGVSKATSTVLPFWIAHEIDGATAVAGDQAAHLNNQYIGSLAEQTLAVKR